MPLFIIERSFAEKLEPTDELVAQLQAYNEDASLRWLFSFLSADGRRSYCLYEAADAEALRRQAEDLGFPADVVLEVSEVNPRMAFGQTVTGFVQSPKGNHAI